MGKKQLFTQKDLEELNEELNKHLNLDTYKGMFYRNMKFDVDVCDYNSLILEYALSDKTREEYEKECNEIDEVFGDSDASLEGKTKSLGGEWSTIVSVPVLSQAEELREKILADLSKLENDVFSCWKKFREFESSILDLCHNIPSLRQRIEESKNDIHMNYTSNKIVGEIGEIIKATAKISESLSRVDYVTEHSKNANASEIINFQMEILKEGSDKEIVPEIETAGIGFLDKDEDEDGY